MIQTKPPPAPSGTGKPALRPACLAATAAAGLAAAAWVPGSTGPGLFLVIIALLSGLAVVLAGTEKPTHTSLAFASVGIVLVAMPAIRAAEWLVVPDLFLALLFAAFAVTDPKSWSQALLGVLTPSARLPHVPGAALQSASGVLGSADPARITGVLRGVVVGGLLAGVFWALFASADRAFMELTGKLIPDWDLGLVPLRFLCFGVAFVVTIAFALSRISGPPALLSAIFDFGEKNLPSFKVGRAEWITALGLLNVLFLAFTTVQVFVLFQGHDHILETAGLTYAEYARQGFFQLLVAAALVLPIVGLAWSRSNIKSQTDEVVIKALLGMLSLLTLGIVISAVRRLGLYEEAFGFSRLRLSAHAIALWLGVLLVLLLAAGAAGRTKWLFAGILAATAGTVLIFNFMNPDAMIARRNLERFEVTGKIDHHYLSTLSPDAVPALLELPDDRAESVLSALDRHLSEPEPWSDANLSRIHARRLLHAESP